ncbi:BaiN/RdsA family NAD(P)/FAD-dependent oxidoreductase [Flavitalea sp.]|nr:NAD(P)/FAD-dependent oxidoreductase [Flavitalea sp.]
MKKRLIVIGGGASGFFCAVNAKRLNPRLEVIIVEKTSKILAKVRISGGGRCNVTHECFEIPVMAKRYPRGSNLVKKSFHQFFTTDTIEWFRARGVLIRAEADGRMFPVTNSSETIIECLLREMNKQGVQLLYNKDVKALRKEGENWHLSFDDDTMTCDYVCIACGGYPKAASFSWLTVLGHTIEAPVPSLFTFNMPANPITALMGVSVELAQVKIVGSRLEQSGPLLITHWGMSGPAILKLSAWGARLLAETVYQFRILVNWLPEQNEAGLRELFRSLREESAAQKISSRNSFGLPQRLWDYLLTESGCKPEWRWADLPSANQNKLVTNLLAKEYQVSGKTTFKEEFVTSGGINLSEINSNTMESKLLPGLYFAGEIMNVDGITGGYNFQHAWTSGFVAASAISRQDSQINSLEISM